MQRGSPRYRPRRGARTHAFLEFPHVHRGIGAPLESIRAYKNGLKALVEDAGHTHIQFDGLENYTKADDPVHEVLQRFHINQMDMNAHIENEPDMGNNMAGRW
ncbi:hypothetical protein V7S43_018645 [Phytophthora oleae]|uniref:Uncharacterized protein n=1 Tax=Phytophthora oleae TaxID=2107226 RepID=A0ABD3EQ01_9STRA